MCVCVLSKVRIHTQTHTFCTFRRIHAPLFIYNFLFFIFVFSFSSLLHFLPSQPDSTTSQHWTTVHCYTNPHYWPMSCPRTHKRTHSPRRKREESAFSYMTIWVIQSYLIHAAQHSSQTQTHYTEYFFFIVLLLLFLLVFFFFFFSNTCLYAKHSYSVPHISRCAHTNIHFNVANSQTWCRNTIIFFNLCSYATMPWTLDGGWCASVCVCTIVWYWYVQCTKYQ